ncbi:MAG: hypothetical protein WC471_03735 [Candidatus Woesearchaeota archaeon]
MNKYLVLITLVLALVLTPVVRADNILTTLAALSVAQNLSLMNHEGGHMRYGGHAASLELELHPITPTGCTWIDGREMSFEQRWKFASAGLRNSIELDKGATRALEVRQEGSQFFKRALAATALWSKLDVTGYVLADEIGLNRPETSDIQNLKRITGKGDGYFRAIAVANVVLNFSEIRRLWAATTGKRDYKPRERGWGFQSDGVDSYVTYSKRF